MGSSVGQETLELGTMASAGVVVARRGIGFLSSAENENRCRESATKPSGGTRGVVRSDEVDPPRERAIRRCLVERLRGTHGVRVVEELVLLRGEIRADIALISSRLDGFEIKSRHDSLERLPRQCAIYSRIFDRVTLVTSPYHLKRARRMIPSWWGIWTARSEGGDVDIAELRSPEENPQVDVEALVQLFWKDEILDIFRSQEDGRRGLQNRTRRDLCRRLVEEVPHPELRRAVRETLGRRENWRSA
jgi:hypothetical protein